MPRTLTFLCLLTVTFAGAPAVAQGAFAAEEQALTKRATKTLSTFASQAKSRKVGPRAKQAYDLILEYDPEHKAARRELDWLKKGGEWVLKPPEKRTKWRDKATYENRFKTMDAWYTTSIKLADLHKQLGLKMQEKGDGRATYHLEKAVYYNPMDEEANLALGLKKGDGFYGTEEQLAFAARLKEIEVKAVEFARKDYEVEELPIDQIPVEFTNLMANAPEWMLKPILDVHGARSPRFTIWTRGSQELANDCAMWAERATDFVAWLIGDKQSKRLRNG